MATTFTATYNGETFTRTSKTRTYTHAVIARRTDYPAGKDTFVYRWSSRADLAAKGAKECGGLIEFVAIVEVDAPAPELPAGVTVVDGKLSGPVKVLRELRDSGRARMTEAGDLVLI